MRSDGSSENSVSIESHRIMLELEPLSPEDAPDAVADILRGAQRRVGFVPNMQGILAHAPAALGTYSHGNKLLAQSSLSAAERTVVFIAASRSNGCTYCVAAHSAGASVGAEVLTALRGGARIDADPRLDALRRFTEQLVEQQGRVSAEQLRDFLAAGFGEAQVLDVVTAVALKTLTNYVGHLTRVSLDDAFCAHSYPATVEESR